MDTPTLTMGMRLHSTVGRNGAADACALLKNRNGAADACALLKNRNGAADACALLKNRNGAADLSLIHI